MKKFFTLFLARAASVSSLWAVKVKIGDLYYNLDGANKTAEVTRKDGLGPYENGYPEITNLSIPSSVVYNGITYNVTTIGWEAFKCSRPTLLSVTIPNSVTKIDYGAFQNCDNLTSISIPTSVTYLGERVFYKCYSLTGSITIPENLVYMGRECFNGCRLTSIVWNAKNCTLQTEDYYGHFNSTITSFVFGETVESIPAYLCQSLNIKSITIPSSVKTIGDYAFYCSSLVEVYINSEVTRIGNNVFYQSLNSIYVPCGTMETYKNAEDWSQYSNMIQYAPSEYTISAITKNGNITVVNNICENKITAVPNRGFYFVKWADGNTENPRTIELTQDTTMEAIFDYQLTGKCGNDNVLMWRFDPMKMALNITGKGALAENYTYGKFIQGLTIGNEITSIGEEAFYRFEKLENIILGSSVKVLERDAFYGCSAIKTITCYSQRPPTVKNYALSGLDYSTIVYVPADYLETYKMHDAWGLYDVRPLGAKSTETTKVTVTISETTVEVIWPSVNGAAIYELVIKDKKGNVICMLIFNANGQLTSIAFNAPSRDHAPQRMQTAGFAFTVTGLESDTEYDMTITAKSDSGATLDVKTLSFRTKGLEAIDQVQSSDLQSTKILRDGQIFILRGNKTYTLTGQEVK